MKIIQLMPLFLVFISFISTAISAEELPRSTMLGISPEDTGDSSNVVLQRVVPNSTGATLGLKPGDQIITINDHKIDNFNALLNVVRPLKAQQPISIQLKREGKELVLAGVMQPRPYEVSDNAQVFYESVSYQGNKLRSITYKPNSVANSETAPAIFFIQGYTCGSIDLGMMPNATTKQLVDQFVSEGYVVFRVEKPGVGDSQSYKHCSEIDFTTESTAFVQALKALKQKSYVNSEQVFLWGHSLGVLHSAVVATAEPVAGIIGYGGVLKPWYDYMLDIYRQQSVKHFGTSNSQAQRNTETIQPFLDLWLNTNTPWSEVVNNKATKAAIDAQLTAVNGEQLIDRHYSFFRDLNRYNLADYWKKLDAPLLMMHGSLDIQAIDKKWAFDLVSLSANSLSKAIEVEGAEHALMRYDSATEYMSARSNRTFNPAEPGDKFDKRIGQHSIDWLKEARVSSETPQYSGVNHLEYGDETPEKTFVGNGFLIEHMQKLYGVTVKHSLLEAKTPDMNSVSIKDHINDWRIHPNLSPNQFVRFGKLLNEDQNELLNMQILEKDWLLFEVKENRSNLEILSLRTSPLQKGEILTAYGCSYSTKDSCIQDKYQGTYISSTKTNHRIDMPELDLNGLRGLSGSPVLDENNQVVGIVSNVMKAESGEGFDFAPANLAYLLSELEKLPG